MRNVTLSTLLVAAATLGCSGVAHADASSGSAMTDRLVLVRTTSGPSSFNFSYGITTATFGPGATSGPGFFGLVLANVEAGRVTSVTPGTQASYARADSPGVYSGGGPTVTTCNVGQCGVSRTATAVGAYIYSDDGGAGSNNVVLIALDGPQVTYKLQSSGWTLETMPFYSQFLDATDQGSTAVTAGSTADGSVELFTDAALPGPSGGSIAQAMPPCSNGGPAILPVRVGAGKVTLSGGTQSPSEICPPLSSPAIADWSPGATTWDLHGLVVGNSTLSPSRLWVTALPPGLPTTG
jgi:hypothetical protein